MSDHANYAHTVQGSGTPTEYGLAAAWRKLTGASEADAAKEVARFVEAIRADERENMALALLERPARRMWVGDAETYIHQGDTLNIVSSSDAARKDGEQE